MRPAPVKIMESMFARQTEESGTRAARRVSGSGFKSSFVLSACIGDNVDNEGGMWRRVQSSHTLRGEAPRPGLGEPNQPAVSASVSPGRDVLYKRSTIRSCD